MSISVVVPAYNEAGRIGAVLEPILGSRLVAEVIVVDDGSEDSTADEASRFPVRLVRLPENRGKAAALDAGVSAAKHDVFLFLDADLVNLRTEHVDRLIRTYVDQDLDMAVGVFADGRRNTDLAQRINPYASGQRILPRRLWERAKENVHEMNFGIEIALSKLAAKEGWKKEYVKLDGVTHVLKEEKRGFAKGVADRLRMYGDMIKWLFKRL
ncbi:MAG: glycosyltransferase family 2 protein [Candidatus Bipolaricaulis sp.]|nr:glycosyltransferase family 2 protein [Candidatus Bipolaricaulis sp.]MDD5219537.1 glycosyltransferase family 2 protein [Candidatus Bipolaricaulis sp.]MDD5646621.1 glycosyltransferase family 2 protein [Candidatus Bipolaricaulis sp.]